MIIEKGKDLMTRLFWIDSRIADFEKEPDAVLVTVDDLVRDGFGTNPLFNVFVAEVNQRLLELYYYRAILPENNTSRRLSCQRNAWYRSRLCFVFRNYQTRKKDQVRRWNGMS
jgi:hypothetical protein